jgi:uncharacterized protein YjbJ (UPF0337 family)
MNRDRLEGHLLRAAGIVQQCWGYAARDDTLRRKGERDRWLGSMQISYAITRDTLLLPPERGPRRAGFLS